MNPRGGSRGVTVAAGIVATAAWAPALTSLAPRRRPALFPRLCGIEPGAALALTFDDGPDAASTPAVLDVLARHHVRATFFLLGRHAAAHADVVRRLVDEGHELAVHGWDHWALPLKRPGTVRGELSRSVEVIETLAGVRPRWYRPPFGVMTTEGLLAARAVGLDTVLWSTWGVDWAARATPESVVRRVLRDARPGGCVLLHDTDRCSAPGSWRTTVAATEALLRHWEGVGQPVGPLGARR